MNNLQKRKRALLGLYILSVYGLEHLSFQMANCIAKESLSVLFIYGLQHLVSQVYDCNTKEEEKVPSVFLHILLVYGPKHVEF